MAVLYNIIVRSADISATALPLVREHSADICTCATITEDIMPIMLGKFVHIPHSTLDSSLFVQTLPPHHEVLGTKLWIWE